MIFISGILQEPYILIGFLIGIIIAISVHEFAHSWAAYRLGDNTPANYGRLTLNPLAHLDVVGTIFLFLAGFGWGKPVPVNPNNFKNPKWDHLWVALSGPISNIIIAFIFALPYRIVLYSGGDMALFSNQPIALILQVIVEINIILAVFNLLPIPPLDGADLLKIFLPASIEKFVMKIGPAILFILLFLELSPLKLNFFSSVFNPIIEGLLYVIRVYPF